MSQPPSSTPPPPPPAGPGGSSDARTWAMAAHLSAFLGAWVAVAFVGPLVIWLIKRDEDPYVAHHSREALNFNLTFLIALVAGAILGFVLTLVTLGLALLVVIPLGAAVGIGWIVLTIIATVRANEGEHYRYPLTIRFVT